MLGIDGKVLGQPPKRKILTVVLQNWEKSAAKHFIEKPISLKFVDLSKIFCPRLSEETYFHLLLCPDPHEIDIFDTFSYFKGLIHSSNSYFGEGVARKT